MTPTNLMRELLVLFKESDDWSLPHKYHGFVDNQLMDEAINEGLVTFLPLPKGRTGYNAYLLTPKGRLFIKRNEE